MTKIPLQMIAQWRSCKCKRADKTECTFCTAKLIREIEAYELARGERPHDAMMAMGNAGANAMAELGIPPQFISFQAAHRIYDAMTLAQMG
jgi:hypothetical protein